MTATAAARVQPVLPINTPIPGGIDGALADGAGGVRSTTSLRDAAWRRTWEAVDAARPGGIPAALPGGDLPAGIHQARWGEVTTRLTGTPRRVDLASQLGRALGIMEAAGVEQAVVGGSFVGAKPSPGDVDVAIIPRRDGRAIDWSLKDRIARVAPDVHVYAGESIVTNATQLPGARAGETFLELFLHDRAGIQRGALLLEPAAAPVEAAWMRSASGGFGDAVRGLFRLRW